MIELNWLKGYLPMRGRYFGLEVHLQSCYYGHIPKMSHWEGKNSFGREV